MAERSFEAIRAAKPLKLYVHCDGPRFDRVGEEELVARCRAIVKRVDWPCSVKTLFRPQNLGLRLALSGAITHFFENEEMGIVLEDDCVPDPSFFPFCGELLERYRYDERVMHIGGSNLLAPKWQGMAESYVFTKFSFVWGWASWRRAWQHFDIDLKGHRDYYHFGDMDQWLAGPLARYYLADKFRATQARENQSWAYAWFYSIVKNRGLCIVSSQNLIQNTGIGDEGATHTTASNLLAAIDSASVQFPLKHPQYLASDKKRDTNFFYASQKQRTRLLPWLLWRIVKKIGELLARAVGFLI